MKNKKNLHQQRKQRKHSHKLLLVVTSVFLVIIFITSIVIFKQFFKNNVLGTAIQQNLVTNGTFQGFDGKQFSNWYFHLQGTGVGTITNDSTTIDPANSQPSARITVTTASPTASWDVQLAQRNIPVSAANSYQLLFDAKADMYRNIDILIQQTNPPYKVYYQETIPLGTGNFGIYPKAVEFTLPSSLSDANTSLRFDFGQATGNIWLNNIQLYQLPNPHPVYFGMEFDNGFQQLVASTFGPSVSEEVNKVHHGFSIVTAYQSWLSAFNTQMYEDMREYGAIPLISWGPHNYLEPMTCQTNTPCEPDFTLESIISGSHDATIKAFADAAKAWGHPMMLRFAWEMNGNWYIWSEQQNGNQAGQFAAAWRHVWQIFHDEGVTNITWVWCPNTDTGYSSPLSELYPGGKYVDWTCVDVYNMHNSSNGWKEFYDAFRPTYEEILKFAPDKPMMVGETGTYENTNDPMAKANWITTTFTKAIPYIFPQVSAILYYDVPSECAQCKIDSSQNSLNALIKAIQLPIYLSNSYGDLPAGIIGPQGQILMGIIAPPAGYQPSPTPFPTTTNISPTATVNLSQTQSNLPHTSPTQKIFPTSFQILNTENPQNAIEQTSPTLTPTPTSQPISTLISPIAYMILHPVTAIIKVNNTITHSVNSFFLHLFGR